MSVPVSSEGTQIVGRYALHGQIAAGGMAVVYFGRLLGPVGFSRPVAVKRLHPQLAREEGVRRTFIDEARLASRIAHPNVVPTLDVVEDGEELLLVLEYVHGESLDQLMKSMRRRGELIPVRVALGVATAVLHGLHAAHEATGEDGAPLHIVHRDVSPQNVLVGADGVARVLDFGIAHAAVRLETTRDGAVKGKIAYMAPEQLGGAPVDRRADVYGTAVMLWEMLTGRRLFVREDGAGIQMEKLLRGAIEPPSQHRPEVSKLLDAITLNGLARNPEQRFPTAREMALAIEKLGDVARPSEIGEWVELLAADKLAERRLRLQELARDGSAAPLPAPPKVPSEIAPKLPSEVAPSQSPPQPLAVSVSVQPVPRARPGFPAVGYALLGGAVMFAATTLVLGRVAGPSPPEAATPRAAAAPPAASPAPDAGAPSIGADAAQGVR